MKHSQTGIAKKFLFLMVGLLMAVGVNAQSITVSGTVTDPTGEPLIGASVLAEGTTNGASTDIDGNYTIKVAPNAVLVVSYVGYDTKRVPVEGRTTVNVEMSENAVMLNEVVAIGYGTVRKQDATGSVAIVKPDEIEAGLATSVQDMLVGQTPGVVVTTSGGPSGAADIRIRGGASLSASNDPLIVLDGVPLSGDTPLGMGSPLAMINPESIESMTILKDASATAIYGSRASNGVIIITTKKGRSGRPQVTFTANLYVDYARKTADLMNADQFRELIYTKFGQNSAAAGYLGDANTDWQDQIFRTAVSSDYSLAVAGSAGVLPYRVDVTYTNSNGILEGSSMDRVTAGISLTPKFFGDHLSINAKVKGFYVRNNWGQTGAIGQAVSFNPTLPVRNYQPITGGTAAGDFAYLFNGYTEPWTLAGGTVNLENNATYNPVATINQTKNYSNVYRSNGNIQFDYSFHFLPELHANLNLGYDVSKSNDYYNIDANSHMAWKDLPNNYAGGSSRHKYEFRSNTLLEFYLNYKKEFESIKSILDATAGYTWSRDAANGWNDGSNSIQGIATTMGLMSATANGDGTYSLNWDPATASQVDKAFQVDEIDANGNYHWKNHLQLLSFFGRVNYTFKERYLLTATVRGDATSRFSKDNRWGVFPAVALGWRLNDEAFMESARGWLSDLKLRAGWGETGQQAVGSYYNYIPTYTVASPGSYYTNGNGGWLTPYFPDGYNKDLKWETTETWNAGIDFGFLNNRISGAIEYYKRNTRDLLSTVPVAAGASTVAYLPQNIGKMENYGIEFSINAKPVVTDDFTWNISYNVGWNHNEITDLGGLTFGVGGGAGTGGNVQIQKEGYPAFSFNLYQQVYGEDGNPIPGAYVDQNGDGNIDTNDLVVRYSKDPKVTMTFSSNFRYKKWDFGFTLRANIGNYVYAGALRSGTNLDGLFRNNQLSNVWKSDYYFDTNDTNLAYSDYWLRNASFVRCDNINLGYTFDNLLNDNLKLRIFAAVQNPFVITKYKGLDPEVFSGVDGNIYPRATTWSLGVVANF
ncbi:MAG: TonB-dependent receptor [Muribaculaceae bacterium]|nr:TonB-dependent receptor [Muribaculaceae bacterium]